MRLLLPVAVYASAWIKHYYPAAFCAALLRAQPMGFYSPQSLVADARRHGVTTRGVDINLSLAHATLEPVQPGSEATPCGSGSTTPWASPNSRSTIPNQSVHKIQGLPPR